MTPPIRVAHYGTGHTGTLALRQLLQRPDLRLVGHLVHTTTKIGMDSGDIIGTRQIGVRATGSLDEFCALDADCVTYFATEFGRDVNEVIDEICQILASGKSVVSTAFVRLVYPRSLPTEIIDKLEKACWAGHSSFFGTGIAPGFTTDALPTYCASLTNAVRAVHISERVLQGTYSDPLSFHAMGFGTRPAGSISDLPADEWIGHFEGSMKMLADGFGWELQTIRAHQDFALAECDYDFEAGAIPVGTVAAVRLRFDGIVDGEPRLKVSIVYTMPDEPGDAWVPARPTSSTGRRFTHITIDGDPNLALTLELSGGDLPGADATATRALNAITTLCNSAPGVYSALDLVVGSSGKSTKQPEGQHQ